MRTGLKTRRKRYSLAGRAWHGCGHGTGVDCGGRYRCRVALNGTYDLPHHSRFVTPGPVATPPTGHGFCWLFPNLSTAMRPVCVGYGLGGRTPCGQSVDFALQGERVDRPWIDTQSGEDLNSKGGASLHGLSTLIHRLPTLRRGGIGRSSQRINNSKLLILS